MSKSSSNLQAQPRGFTLLEVLIVVGIISILAAVVILAVNPAKMLGNARNAKRQADVNTIMNALYQNAVDNNGTIPIVTTTETEICSTATACTGTVIVTTGLNLHTTLVAGSTNYLAAIPCDPSVASCSGSASSTYSAQKDATTGRITIRAKVTDLSATISITR